MEMCEYGGCMSKISGNQLKRMFLNADIILNQESEKEAESTNFEMEDSAILTKIDSDLLFTTDFGPLVGDDCQYAGKIAALNALSDIYAMGGKPLYATIILMMASDITVEERNLLFSSMVNTCQEEKVSVVGGHSIEANQTIVGMSVIGCTGKKVFRKNICNTEDVLLLSKPLGTGLSLRGYYNGLLNEEQYNKAISIMLKSNRIENEMLELPYIHSMTDITGFGLLGHLSEMLNENQGAMLHISKIPFLDSILELSPIALSNSFIDNNFLYAQEKHRIKWHMDSIHKMALCDPQTNGPILISANREILPFAEKYGFYFIGEVTDDMELRIVE